MFEITLVFTSQEELDQFLAAQDGSLGQYMEITPLNGLTFEGKTHAQRISDPRYDKLYGGATRFNCFIPNDQL